MVLMKSLPLIQAQGLESKGILILDDFGSFKYLEYLVT